MTVERFIERLSDAMWDEFRDYGRSMTMADLGKLAKVFARVANEADIPHVAPETENP